MRRGATHRERQALVQLAGEVALDDALRAGVDVGGGGVSGELVLDALGILFRGFGSLFLGFDSREGRGWNIFFGIIMLIGGVVILVQPLISLVTLAWVVGIWLIVIGIYEIIAAFIVRSRTKALA